MESIKKYVKKFVVSKRRIQNLLGDHIVAGLSEASRDIAELMNLATPEMPDVVKQVVQTMCRDLNRVIDEDNSTSLDIIEHIIRMKDFIATKCDHSYWVSVSVYFQLGDAIEVLSNCATFLFIHGVTSSEETEDHILQMTKQLFLIWNKIKAHTETAKLLQDVVVQCLKYALEKNRTTKIGERGRRTLCLATDHMIFKLCSSPNQSALSAYILQKCGYDLNYIVNEMFFPVLKETLGEETSDDDLEVFQCTRKVYDVLEALVIVDKSLVAGLMGKMTNTLTRKNVGTDVLKFFLSIFSMNFIPDNGPPCEVFPKAWKALKRRFSTSLLSGEEFEIFVDFSPAILKVNEKWLSIIKAQLNLHKKKSSKTRIIGILKGLAKDESFISNGRMQSCIIKLITVGSPEELDGATKKELIESLCAAYQSYRSSDKFMHWEAAQSLQSLVLESFDTPEAIHADWSMARALIRTYFVDGSSPKTRAEHLLVLYSLATLNSYYVLREVFSANFHVTNVMRRVLDSKGTIENFGPLSRQILLHMKITDLYEGFMIKLVKEASTNDKLKTCLCNLMDFSQEHTSKTKDASKKDVLKILEVDDQKGKRFMEDFFTLIEPVVNLRTTEALRDFISDVLNNGKIDDAIGDIVTLSHAVITLRETIHHCPDVGFAPGMAELLLRLCSIEDELEGALDCIVLCKRDGRLKWQPDEEQRIRTGCLNCVIETRDMAEAFMEKARIWRKWALRALETVLPSDGEGSTLPNEFLHVIEAVVRDLNEEPRDSSSYELAVTTAGHIAKQPIIQTVSELFTEEIIPLITRGLQTITTSALSVENSVGDDSDRYKERQNLPQPLRLYVEELRSLGRCLRYCITEKDSEDPDFFRKLLEFLKPFLQHPGSDSTEMVLSAGWLRLEASCTLLFTLENKLLQNVTPVKVISTLARVAMDSNLDIRKKFMAKITRGLMVVRDMDFQASRSKGNLAPVMAVLLPLSLLSWSDDDYCLSQPESESTVSTSSEVSHVSEICEGERLIRLVVKSFRRHLHMEFSNQTKFRQMSDFVENVLPYYVPEFIIVNLVPVLAELPILNWYTQESQLKRPKPSILPILKQIYSCFVWVLEALSGRGSYFPRLSHQFVQGFPDKMLKRMKFQNVNQRKKQVLLCCMLKKAISNYREGATHPVPPMTLNDIHYDVAFYKSDPTPSSEDWPGRRISPDLDKIIDTFPLVSTQSPLAETFLSDQVEYRLCVIVICVYNRSKHTQNL